MAAGIPVRITGTNTDVHVTKAGQLVTAPFAYDEVVAITLDVDDQAYNFYKPVVDKQFVLTGILLTADSNVTGSALIDIYEGTTVSDTVISKAILHVEILKNGSRDITGLNIIVSSGLYVNAKTDDDDVFVTIMGYYIPKV